MEKATKEGLEKGMQQGLEQGIQQGLEQGIQQGIQQGKELGEKLGKELGQKEKALSIAKNLKEMGLALDQISNATGLSKEEIESL